jgi:hypothetical protein
VTGDSANRKSRESDTPTAASRREKWWKSILRDVAYGLRHQEVSREEIADMIDRVLEDGVPDD